VAKRQRRNGGVLAIALGVVALSVAGCASKDDAAKLLNPDPPGKMYAEADSLLNRGKWEAAARKFEALDRDHPYAPEARRAMVLSAYAYYKAALYDTASRDEGCRARA
jgi:outer membrane protein assembly factor BamD